MTSTITPRLGLPVVALTIAAGLGTLWLASASLAGPTGWAEFEQASLPVDYAASAAARVAELDVPDTADEASLAMSVMPASTVSLDLTAQTLAGPEYIPVVDGPSDAMAGIEGPSEGPLLVPLPPPLVAGLAMLGSMALARAMRAARSRRAV